MRLKMDGWLKRCLEEWMTLIIRRSAGLSSAVSLPRLLNQLLGHPCHALAVLQACPSIKWVGGWVGGLAQCSFCGDLCSHLVLSGLRQ